MEFTIGKKLDGNKVAGLYVYLGAKETLQKSIQVKPEDWDAWAKNITDTMATVATVEPPAEAPEQHEVCIQSTDSIQYLTLENIKPLICGATE